MIHLPLLRHGRPYRSLEVLPLWDVRSGEPVAEVSQAHDALMALDLATQARAQAALARLPAEELLELCRRAARLFLEADLPLDGCGQSPTDYVRQQAATTGIPERLCRENMAKIHFVLDRMDLVVAGLTRGLDLTTLDAGWALTGGHPVSYRRQTDTLGVVLPSNSPGVHSLWIPALALKIPVLLKPGGHEPWTPWRIAQALLAAGCPPEALGFYPTGHAGATELLLRCGRSMLFGTGATVRAWRHDPRVQVHGPGWSKILLGEDELPHWESHLELIVTSVASNGGRSCVNASGLWVPARGREIGEALARRLVTIEPRPLDHPEAELAAFGDPVTARRVSQLIDRHLGIPGARDLTAELRGGERIAEVDGCSFLLPTVIWCEDPDHPLAQTELLFPFVSVVEVRQEEMLDRIGPSLVVTAVTRREDFRRQLMASTRIERLNLGPIPTSRVAWDQPHEGNLFEHLYQQRALQTPELVRESAAAGGSAP